MHTLDPIRQFAIESLLKVSFFGYTLNITNSALSVFTLCFVSILISLALKYNRKLIPNHLQSILESIFIEINKMCDKNLEPEVKKYHNFVFSIFLFILISNLIGLFPYSFASTSHISVTFLIAMLVFVATVFIIIKKHGYKSLLIFVPSGTPLLLVPILFVLEFFSFLIRPISLSIRLAANMIAGHIMLDVIAFFVIMMKWAGILPFLILTVMMGFELAVAVLQAYIFTSFACVYINQANMDHH